MSIFERLFGVGCKHQWEIINQEDFNLYDGYDGYDPQRLPVGKKYIITLRCKNCGDVKMKKYEL